MIASLFVAGEQTVKTVLGSTLMLAALLPAIASAQGQQVNIFWFEDASCAAWVKSSGNKALRAQYEFWIRGFVSGHNYARPSHQVKVGEFPGSEALHQYLDQYCRDNPKTSFVGGAIQLVEQLLEPAATARPLPAKKEPVKAATPGAK
jgi:hypothetical protein